MFVPPFMFHHRVFLVCCVLSLTVFSIPPQKVLVEVLLVLQCSSLQHFLPSFLPDSFHTLPICSLLDLYDLFRNVLAYTFVLIFSYVVFKTHRKIGICPYDEKASKDLLALSELVPPEPTTAGQSAEDETAAPYGSVFVGPDGLPAAPGGNARELGRHNGGPRRMRLHGGHFITQAADEARLVFGLPKDNEANRLAVRRVVLKWMKAQPGVRKYQVADSWQAAVELVFVPTEADLFAAAFRRSAARSERVQRYNLLVDCSKDLPDRVEPVEPGTYVPLAAPEF